MKTLQLFPSINTSSIIRSKKIIVNEIINERIKPQIILFKEKRSLANLSSKKMNKLALAKYKLKLYRLV